MSQLDLLTNMRAGFLIAWVLAWNAILGLGILRDGGMRNGPGFALSMAVAGLGTAVLCCVVLFTERGRNLAMRPGASVASVRRELMLMGFITASVGAGALASVLLG